VLVEKTRRKGKKVILPLQVTQHILLNFQREEPRIAKITEGENPKDARRGTVGLNEWSKVYKGEEKTSELVYSPK